MAFREKSEKCWINETMDERRWTMDDGRKELVRSDEFACLRQAGSSEIRRIEEGRKQKREDGRQKREEGRQKTEGRKQLNFRLPIVNLGIF